MKKRDNSLPLNVMKSTWEKSELLSNNFKKNLCFGQGRVGKCNFYIRDQEYYFVLQKRQSTRTDCFTFKNLKEYWDNLKGEVFNQIKGFEYTWVISKGCNASFISLIPKKNVILLL